MKGIHIDEAAVRAEYVETALTDIKARLEAL
jgi:hypothetical protein